MEIPYHDRERTKYQMVAYTFEKIASMNKIGPVDSTAVNEARAWYMNNTKKLGNITTNNLAADKDRLVNNLNKFSIGRMYMFYYDAKYKKELPYWDRFPLIFPIEMYADGFLGINLHYISPLARAKLMDALYSTINNKKNDDTTRLTISYKILKNASQFSYFRPCVKRYLYSQVKSRYFYITPAEWDTTILLPTEQFVGADKSKVYRDSSKQF